MIFYVLFQMATAIALAMLAGAAGFALAAIAGRNESGGFTHAIADFTDYFHPQADRYAAERRVRQVDILMASAPIVGLVNIFNAFVLAAVLYSTAGVNIVLWALTVSIVSLFQFTACVKIQSRENTPSRRQRILRGVIINAALFGFLWGTSATLFYIGATQSGQMLILLTCVGTAAIGAAAYGVLPPAAMFFACILGGQVIGALLKSGGAGESVAAALTMSVLFTMGAIVFGAYEGAVNRPALKAAGREGQGNGQSPNAASHQPAGR